MYFHQSALDIWWAPIHRHANAATVSCLRHDNWLKTQEKSQESFKKEDGIVSYRLFVSKEPQDRVSLISRSRAHVISSTSREKKKNKEGQKKNIVGLFFTLCCTRGLRKKRTRRRRGAEKSFFFVDFPSYLEGKRSVVFSSSLPKK